MNEQTLANVGSKRALPWQNLGLMLADARKRGWWEHSEARSYTQWLRDVALKSGLKPAYLWRVLAATRFYDELCGRYKTIGLPALPDLPAHVSPDHLEALGKLDRVLSSKELRALLVRLLEGDLTRTELRQIWKAYRPALDGHTARGRHSAVPKVNRKNPMTYSSMLEGRLYRALITAGPAWTGSRRPARYRLFHELGPIRGDYLGPLPIFDAVALVVERTSKPVETHALEFVMNKSPHFHDESRRLTEIQGYTDFLWAVLPEDPSVKAVGQIPIEVGVLYATEQRITVVRRAQEGRKAPERREALLRAALERALRE